MSSNGRPSGWQAGLNRLKQRYASLGNAVVRRVLKNTAYLFSATGISAAISMLQGILTARLLGVANFGILGTVTMFASVVNKFASFRMGELVIKYVGHYSERHDTPRAAAIFKVSALAEMGATMLAFGLIVLLAPLGARYLAKDESLAHWFIIYGLVVLANLIYESCAGLLKIFDRFRRLAVWNIVQSCITLVLIGVAFILKGGLLEILLAYLVGKAFGSLGVTMTALVEATQRWGNGWWKSSHSSLALLRPQWRELSHFAISTNISASLSLINKDSELLWVSFFRSPVETGYYKLALALANLVQMPVSPLPDATYPELSREAAKNNWSNVRFILKNGSRLAFVYSLAATLGLALVGIPLIRFFYTPAFLPAYPALLILLVGYLVANTFYWHRTALLTLGRPDYPTKVNLVLAVLKVAGIILLVPKFGYLANAALLAGSYLLGVSVSAWKANALLVKRANDAAERRVGDSPVPR